MSDTQCCANIPSTRMVWRQIYAQSQTPLCVSFYDSAPAHIFHVQYDQHSFIWNSRLFSKSGFLWVFGEWIVELNLDIRFLYCSFLSPRLSLLQRSSCSVPSTVSCLPSLPQFPLHPYHPLCLQLPVSLASLSPSPSQLDSCGTD